MNWINFVVRLTPEQHQKLRELSFSSRLSIAELVRLAVKAFLEGGCSN